MPVGKDPKISAQQSITIIQENHPVILEINVLFICGFGHR
jgi:hypothetical protein